MTDNSGSWQTGDLALCIKQGPWESCDPGEVLPPEEAYDGPKAGQVHRVDDVYQAPEGLLLHFRQWPDTDWLADRFRKINPGTEPVDAEVEKHAPIICLLETARRDD